MHCVKCLVGPMCAPPKGGNSGKKIHLGPFAWRKLHGWCATGKQLQTSPMQYRFLWSRVGLACLKQRLHLLTLDETIPLFMEINTFRENKPLNAIPKVMKLGQWVRLLFVPAQQNASSSIDFNIPAVNPPPMKHLIYGRLDLSSRGWQFTGKTNRKGCRSSFTVICLYIFLTSETENAPKSHLITDIIHKPAFSLEAAATIVSPTNVSIYLY